MFRLLGPTSHLRWKEKESVEERNQSFTQIIALISK